MKTNLYLPPNIFSRIFLSEINSYENIQAVHLDSSLIAQRLREDQDSVGLMPALDLLRFQDMFVSSGIGISFNALLSNSYLHFREGQDSLEEIFLKGDVSLNDLLMSKILFKEFYDIDVRHTLISDENSHRDSNLLIVGDENYQQELFLNGLSFAEEVIELIGAPYVNFVLACNSDKLLREFTAACKNDFQNGHKENYKNLLNHLPLSSLEFISVNLQHVVFDLEEQDLEGIRMLLQMPYYHGMIKEMIDIKFV